MIKEEAFKKGREVETFETILILVWVVSRVFVIFKMADGGEDPGPRYKIWHVTHPGSGCRMDTMFDSGKSVVKAK